LSHKTAATFLATFPPSVLHKNRFFGHFNG
jgi:hypothetical protein